MARSSRKKVKAQRQLVGSPMLVFVDADIASGRDEIAREQLLKNLRDYRSPGVSPLWVNWLRQRADLRFACFVRDVRQFNTFMLDVVRSVEGLRETRTMLSFGGRANIDALLELEMEVSPNSQMAASMVEINVEPGLDRSCFQSLIDLPVHPDVQRVWLLNTYHSHASDLTMLLLGKDVSSLTGYIMSWVRTTEGVVDTDMSMMLDWRWLAGPDDIVEVCEHFFIQEAHRTAFR